MIEVLAAIGGVGTLGLGAAVVVLALRYVSLSRELLAARDLLDGQRALTDQYKSERDIASTRADLLARRLSTEEDFRAIAEAQRDTAQTRFYGILRTHIKDASDDELRALSKQAFATPLSLLPGNELLPLE